MLPLFLEFQITSVIYTRVQPLLSFRPGRAPLLLSWQSASAPDPEQIPGGRDSSPGLYRTRMSPADKSPSALFDESCFPDIRVRVSLHRLFLGI
jgi:hypothetical protein